MRIINRLAVHPLFKSNRSNVRCNIFRLKGTLTPMEPLNCWGVFEANKGFILSFFNQIIPFSLMLAPIFKDLLTNKGPCQDFNESEAQLICSQLKDVL